MSQENYREFIYQTKEDYDASLSVNGEKLAVYSAKKVRSLYPGKDLPVLGETFEAKKRDKQKDIGRIELNEKRLNVVPQGSFSRLFRKPTGYAAVQGEGLIALLRLRLLPFLLVFALLVGGVACSLLLCRPASAPPQNDAPNIQPARVDMVTISGTVTKAGQPVEGAVLSLQLGNETVGTATTDKDGHYLISNVADGNYNLVCSCLDSTLTKLASVSGMPVTVDFMFPADDLHDLPEIIGGEQAATPIAEPATETQGDSAAQSTLVNALVKLGQNDTPSIAVGGLDIEALQNMQVGKRVDLTFTAAKLSQTDVPAQDAAAITEISGELTLTYYDFSVLKEVYVNSSLESSEYLTQTQNVFQVAVPYDSSTAVGTYVFRYHDSEAFRFEQLTEKPTEGYRDGTYYVTADTVYIYTDRFSTYAIGSANAGRTVNGVDTITYSDTATVNLKTGVISMFYQHDEDSTNDAVLQLYLVGEDGNLLIAESGIIPAGYQISELQLSENLSAMPSVGTYNGLLKIIYPENDTVTATNVDIPLSVAITQ